MPRSRRAMDRVGDIDPTKMYLVTVMPRAAGQVAIDLLIRDEDLPRTEARRRQDANGYGHVDPYSPYRAAFDQAKEADPRFTHRDQFYVQQ